MKLEIKRFYPFDKAGIFETGIVAAKLFEAIRYYNKHSLRFIFDADTPENMMKSIKESKMTVLYAVLNGKKIIGFTTFKDSGDRDEDDREMQIFMMPRWRFKGYGQEVLYLSEEFICKRYKKVKTLSAQISNKEVRSLLEKSYWEDCCFCGEMIKYLR
jgi:hypothetical protein